MTFVTKARLEWSYLMTLLMIESSLENYESGHLRKKEVEYVAQRPKIDIKNANVLNGFSAVLKSLFAADGTFVPLYRKEFVDVYSERPTTQSAS